MQDLFEKPIRVKKVRNGVYAYKYRQFVNIAGQKYVGYSLIEAIKQFRAKSKPN